MRIKSSFVTNSSTCAFVMAGIPIKEDFNYIEMAKHFLGDKFDPAYWEKIEDSYDALEVLRYTFDIDIDVLEGSDDGVPTGYSAIIGRKIADFSDDEGITEQELPFSEILEFLDDLSKKLGLEDIKPKLFCGMRMC